MTAGVETDVLGLHYEGLAASDREAIVQAHPREEHFKEPAFRPGNFCQVIRQSCWES